MNLVKLLRSIERLSVSGPLQKEITGLSCDSRRVVTGNIFFALNELEPELQAQYAIQRGATVIISEKELLANPRATVIRVADARLAMGRIAAAYYDHPARRLEVIGINGPHGQKDIAFILKQILENAGIACGMMTTDAALIGERTLPGRANFSDAIELQKRLSEMAGAGCKTCVLELPSPDLDAGSFSAIHFRALVVTRFGGALNCAHPINAWRSKLPSVERELSLILNADEQPCARLQMEHDLDELVTYGLSEHAEVRGLQVNLGLDETRFHLQIDRKSFPVYSPLIGRENLYHTLAAAAVARVMQLPAARIAGAIRKLKPLPGNLRAVQNQAGLHVFIDAARTGGELSRALGDLTELKRDGRIILVFGGRGNAGAQERSELASAAREADYAIITTDNCGLENSNRISRELSVHFRSNCFEVTLDREEAIRAAIEMAEPGDLILIAGKGEQATQEIDGAIIPFDDLERAEEALEIRTLLRPALMNEADFASRA